jgi:hypothetical protein
VGNSYNVGEKLNSFKGWSNKPTSGSS